MRSNLFCRLSVGLCIFLVSLSSNAQLPSDISTKILGTWKKQYDLGSWTFNANGTITDCSINYSEVEFDGLPVKGTITGEFCSYEIEGQVLKTVAAQRRDLNIEAEVMNANTLKPNRLEAWKEQKKSWIQTNIRNIQLDQERFVGAEANFTIRSFSDNKMELVDKKGNVKYFVRGNLHTGPMINNHEYVDLGLSSGTLWATCNVGASSPSEIGDYYAYGETNTKNDYQWSNYKYCNRDETKLTKYCTSLQYTSSYDYVDNKKDLDLSDDVAHVKWGGTWRVPSAENIKELISECKWKQLEWGHLGIGPNGNSIFIPKAGVRYKNTYDALGSRVILGTSSIAPKDPTACYILSYSSTRLSNYNSDKSDIDEYAVELHDEYRFFGFQIRPVSEMTPEVKAKREAEEKAKREAEEKAKREAEEARIKAENEYWTRIGIEKKASAEKAAAEGVKLVDLGLSVRWADRNIGASSEMGDCEYFAWAETQTKEEFAKRTYKPAKKYKANMSLEPSDDASTKRWGLGWHIPTPSQWEELKEKCILEGVKLNGSWGLKVTGPNGNSIFLPFNRGKMEVSESRSKEGAAYYWTNTLTSEKTKAICYSISTGYRMVKNLDDVYYGLPIRAVME